MLAAVLLVALVGAWQLYCNLGHVDPIVFPAPNKVAEALWDHRSLLTHQLGVTAREMAVGLLAGIVLALVCALLMHRFRTARRAIYPLAIASQAVPVTALAPILVFWWGFGITPKVFVIALVCFFPVLVPVLDGLRSVDSGMIKLMRSLGASRRQLLLLVEAPATLPGLLTGAKLSVAVTSIAAVLAEGTGATSDNGGLGVLILQSQGSLDTALAIAAIVILSVFSLVLFGLVSVLERHAVPWAIRKDPPQ